MATGFEPNLGGDAGMTGAGFPQQAAAGGADPNFEWWKRGADGLVPGSEEGTGRTWPDGMEPTHREIEDYTPRQMQSKSQMLQSLLLNSVNNPDALITLQQQMVRAGLLNPRSKKFISGDMFQGDATWLAADSLFDKAIQTGTDWRELLAKQAKTNKGGAGWKYYLKMFGQDGMGAGDGSALIDQTTTNRSTTVSTKMDAQALLTQSLQQNLGRDPSREELNAFTSALQAYERANPQVTSTHTKGEAGGDATSSTTNSGGANPEVFAENYSMREDNQDEVTSLRGRGFVDQFERMMRGG